MNRPFFLLIAALLCCATTTAQIKIVGEEYARSLTGSKSYYENDVDFEKCFPPMDGAVNNLFTPFWFIFNDPYISTYSTYGNANLIGDTVYLPEDVWIESVLSTTVINMNNEPNYIFIRDFCINNEGKPVNGTMSKGYYEIVGYVFCSDNEDSIRAMYNLSPPLKVDCNYILNLRGHRIGYHIDTIAENNEYSVKALKDNILQGKVGDIYDYIMYVVFRPLDSESDSIAYYYLSYKNRYDNLAYTRAELIVNSSIVKTMMPLRFYNVLKSYIGEEVVLLNKPPYGSSDNVNVIGKLIRDSISDRLVKIMDNVFIVKDVVMMNNHYYIVLEGSNTGSFAFPITYILPINTIEFRVPYYEIDLVKSSGDVLCLIFELYCIIKKRDIELLKKRQVTANSQLEIERKKQMLRMQQDKEKKEADFKQRMLAKYGAGYGEMVSKRQVAVDMSKEMCLDAWGKPMNTYRTTTKYGQSEVWCYNYKTRVYFYNGKVVQIDD